MNNRNLLNILFLSALSFFVSNKAMADIYCPQRITCIYDKGCSVTDPVPYKDASYFNFYVSDYVETDYHYDAVWALADSVTCWYHPDDKNSLSIQIYSLKLTSKNIANPANWKRISQRIYKCIGSVVDCAFKDSPAK